MSFSQKMYLQPKNLVFVEAYSSKNALHYELQQIQALIALNIQSNFSYCKRNGSIIYLFTGDYSQSF